MINNISYYNRRLVLLRWVAGAATLFQIFILTLDFFDKAIVFQEITEFYLFILWTYGIKNLLVGWRNKGKNYWGDVYVYLIWLYCAFIYLYAAVKETSIVVPSQLKFTWEGVTVLYISTGILNILRKLFLEDIKKFLKEIFRDNK